MAVGANLLRTLVGSLEASNNLTNAVLSELKAEATRRVGMGESISEISDSWGASDEAVEWILNDTWPNLSTDHAHVLRIDLLANRVLRSGGLVEARWVAPATIECWWNVSPRLERFQETVTAWARLKEVSVEHATTSCTLEQLERACNAVLADEDQQLSEAKATAIDCRTHANGIEVTVVFDEGGATLEALREALTESNGVPIQVFQHRGAVPPLAWPTNPPV